MTRLEAIYAMLEGKKIIRPNWANPCFFSNSTDRFCYYENEQDEIFQMTNSEINDPDGYELYEEPKEEEPAQDYAMINGEKYKLVREK